MSSDEIGTIAINYSIRRDRPSFKTSLPRISRLSVVMLHHGSTNPATAKAIDAKLLVVLKPTESEY
jgi:hypothetical protein